MQWGVLGASESVQIAQGLLELPAAVERGPFAPQRVEHIELHVAQVAGILEQRPAGVLDPPGLGRRGWGALSRPTPFPLRLWVSPSFLVPRSPSRLVDRLVGQLHNVEGIDALGDAVSYTHLT